MAAAALGCAARRLGGRVLQRPQQIFTAAVEDIQGGRAVWPTSSRRSRSSSSSGSAESSTDHACAKSASEPLDQKHEEYLASTYLKEIEKKKEELFHLIAKVDSKFPSYCQRNNRQLLMELTVHVQPKPDDPQWRWYRRAKIFNKYYFYGGMLYLAYMATSDEISQIYAALVE